MAAGLRRAWREARQPCCDRAAESIRALHRVLALQRLAAVPALMNSGCSRSSLRSLCVQGEIEGAVIRKDEASAQASRRLPVALC